MDKRAAVISCFDYHACRMVYWENSLKELGYQTTYITSDFHHGSKQPYTCTVPDSRQLHVMPYQKNLSVQRILSHRMFARQVLADLEKQRPSIVVASIPPNFLVKYLAKYKRRHPEIKLILDIYDLWPETFPSSRIKQLLAPVFRIWSGLRDKYLPQADFTASECGLFLDRMKKRPSNSRVIHFSLPPYADNEQTPVLPTDQAQIAYLGSINNIIDIPTITALLGELQKQMPTTLHIIGDGESRQTFCDAAESVGVSVVFHGKVFDEQEKHRILSNCHFGLNIMKPSVCVGLTMKSVDYLRHGLPLISSIPADTKELIEKYRAGFHMQSPAQTAAQIADAIRADVAPLKDGALHLYNDHLTSDINQSACSEVVRQVLSGGEK